jgi:hypothetical protein
MARQKHNLAALFPGVSVRATFFGVVKNLLFHNRRHYSKFYGAYIEEWYKYL